MRQKKLLPIVSEQHHSSSGENSRAGVSKIASTYKIEINDKFYLN